MAIPRERCRASHLRSTPVILCMASLFLSCPVSALVSFPNAERDFAVATSRRARPYTAWSISPTAAQRSLTHAAERSRGTFIRKRWWMSERFSPPLRRWVVEEASRGTIKSQNVPGESYKGWATARSRRFPRSDRSRAWAAIDLDSKADVEALPRSLDVGDQGVGNRFIEILAADETKKLGCWMVFALVLSRLRSFYGVMLGTFVLSYMGNTVIQLSMRKGNDALHRIGRRLGWRRLPKKLPRTVYAAVYILLLLTAITSLSVITVPRLTVESQVLIAKLSEQDNPYAIIASWIQSNFGEEALTRLEPFLLSVTGDQGRIFAGDVFGLQIRLHYVAMNKYRIGRVYISMAATAYYIYKYPDNYLEVIASKLKDRGVWTEVRYSRFAKLLQFCLSRYFKGGLNMCSAIVAGLTKVLYKAMVSLLFSFMVIWDLPNLRRGMKALKTSRLAFAYNTISPQVGTFAKLVGQSFEVQFTIAVINTLLTTAGLIGLGVSGPLVLSFIVFLCSFVPVVGVFISTLPMCVAGLADYGMSKVFQIILMVLGVHAVEAYLLNPQIYASKLKLHPVVVIGVLYVAEHVVGVQGLIVAVPCAVFVINNVIMGNNNHADGPLDDEDVPHAEPKTGDSAGAPLQLMAQFLRAVSESRMEDALALAQTILTFEPRNPLIMDYQATLAQYINNERKLAEEDSDERATSEESSSCSSEEHDSDTCSEDESTEEPSGDEACGRNDSNDDENAANKNEKRPRTYQPQDRLEERRLGQMLRSLRQARAFENQESMSRWDEEKFAASRREVEAVLWQFLPAEARQAAKDRAKAVSEPEEPPKPSPDK